MAGPSLNEAQNAAVTYPPKPLLVLAGAGSGKTRVLTHRIVHMVDSEGISPSRILAVTFTNKAAKEMRVRVADLLGGSAPQSMWVTTFHSLGARMLRMNALAAGLDPDFSIFDSDDSLRLVKRIIKELNLDPKKTSASSVSGAIGRYKCNLITPAQAMESPDILDHLPGKIYDLYEKELAAQSAVDFGDLIVRPVRLLREDEEVRKRYQDRFRYLMVDEYQDTNHAQYLFIRLLAGKDAYVCAVGDEDQSIYGWRGADIQNILDYKSDFPGTRVLQLEQNYRCPKPVLEAANAMIGNNQSRMKEREVWSEKSSLHKVNLYQAWSADEEGKFVADAIRYLRMEDDRDYSEFAVFYRTHAQARALEQAMMRSRIPYKVFGGPRFFERKIIKDLVSYLRVLVNPKDREAMARIINTPKRGVGPKALSTLMTATQVEGKPIGELLSKPKLFRGKAAAQVAVLNQHLIELRERLDHCPPEEILSDLIQRIEYDVYISSGPKPEDIELVSELQNAMIDYTKRSDEPSLQGFLEEAALVAATDSLEDDSGEVSLMTLHNAKGLEYPVAFVTGLEEGILPHANSIGLHDRKEEERRLLYVGMTRAKERLFLTCARFRTIHGTSSQRLPSEFLSEIGAEHLDTGEEEY